MHKGKEGLPSALQTINIAQMLEHYRLSEEDASRLHALQPLMEKAVDDLLPGFYEFIFSFEHARIFLHGEEILQKHSSGIRQWFIALFCGTYDESYFQQLNRISETHVRIGLPSHYVNTAFSFVRNFLEKLLIETENRESLAAMNKIIDINLDILSLTYREQTQQQLIGEVLLLKQALKHQSVKPYVQPITELQTGEIAKFECLMRIINPKNGEVFSIYPFLEIAKNIKLYEGLMTLMIQHSFDVFRTLPWTFSINLGYEDIADEHFLEFLYEQIENFPQPNRIIFEILESDFIEDFNIVFNFVSTIREYGCQIAIDDFGAGYSNIENILKLKPDYLKIDASLIRKIDTSETAYTVVKNVANMAKELHIQTIAEHIHKEEIFDIVKSLQIDFAQGYYTGRPFPASELLK
jgi:EAL domain-containing protein (putative c-di-GMP-specific phosphodiesterase class I)